MRRKSNAYVIVFLVKYLYGRIEQSRKKKGRNAFLYLTKVPKFGVANANSVDNIRIAMTEEVINGQSISGFNLKYRSMESTNNSVNIEFSIL